MSRQRWIVMCLLLAVLLGLLAWQVHREGMMQACLEQGRTWNGRQSRCEAPRIGPILKRAIERS